MLESEFSLLFLFNKQDLAVKDVSSQSCKILSMVNSVGYCKYSKLMSEQL